jgi:hypothetical protein
VRKVHWERGAEKEEECVRERERCRKRGAARKVKVGAAGERSRERELLHTGGGSDSQAVLEVQSEELRHLHRDQCSGQREYPPVVFGTASRMIS